MGRWEDEEGEGSRVNAKGRREKGERRAVQCSEGPRYYEADTRNTNKINQNKPNQNMIVHSMDDN